MRTKRTCSFPGCPDPYLAKGFCQKHYKRWRLYGDPHHVEAPNNFKDLLGQTFGRLTVVARAPRPADASDTNAYWLCRCECDNEVALRANSLLSGKTQSCGCFRVETSRERSRLNSRKHGYEGSRTYISWAAMKQRTLNPNHEAYGRYGGRGITIHEPWVRSFEAFLADMGERPEGTTLDRINPDGNYAPGNCRWATWSEQARNQRRYRPAE